MNIHKKLVISETIRLSEKANTLVCRRVWDHSAGNPSIANIMEIIYKEAYT